MKLGGHRLLGHDALLFVCFAQSPRHIWTYQSHLLSSHGPLGKKVEVFRHKGDSKRRPHAVEHVNHYRPHDDPPKSEDPIYSGSSTGGGGIFFLFEAIFTMRTCKCFKQSQAVHKSLYSAAAFKKSKITSGLTVLKSHLRCT